MDSYRFSSYPPTAIPGYQPYIGTPHRNSLNLYQASSITPYLMSNEYNTPHLPHMYLPQTLPVYTPSSGINIPYHQQILEDEPSCFDSFLENLCCCFGFGPQNHQEVMHRHEMQRIRLIAKEERNRMLIYQKENQRLAQIQQRQQQKQQQRQQQAAIKPSVTPSKSATANTPAIVTATTV